MKQTSADGVVCSAFAMVWAVNAEPQFLSVTGAWSNSGVSQELKADDGLFQVIEATDPATISGNPGRFIRVRVSRP